MKKLLFTLVATAACGVASAAAEDFSQYTLGAEFSAATNTAGEVSGSNPGNWTIDMSTGPEMLITNNVADTITGNGNYLQINTGSTPLWRTFASVTTVDDATNGVPQATTIDDGTVVSSKVKLTACTEWPELESFWGEKLALFYFDPEEGDTSGNDEALYAVGGTWITVDGQPVFTNKAYKLAVPQAALDGTTGAITNTYGWAKIDIKAYTNVLSEASSYSGFIVAVNDNLVTVETDETDYIGLGTRTLSNAAQARFADKQLILAAATGQFAGLGFQGEGGIDDVDLAADEVDGMADAVTMTANITGATVKWTSTGTSLDGTTLTFVPGSAITFTVTPAAGLDLLTVEYEGKALTAVDGVYTIESPTANATLEVTAEAAKFEVGGVGYANLADALAAAIAAEGTVKLLGDGSVDLGATMLTIESGTVTIDLNGQTLTCSDAYVICNVAGTVTITDSATGGKVASGTEGSVLNASALTILAGDFAGAVLNTGTLNIKGGKFEVALVNSGTLTDNGGMFKDPDGLPEVTGKEYRDDDEDSYYTLEDEAGEEPEPEVPSVGEGEGSVTVDETSGAATVVPAEGKTEVTITLPEGFAGNVIVPSSLDKIMGVPAGKLVIKSGDYVVTGAFSYDATTGAIALNAEATVDGVPVKPVLDTTVTDPFVGGATPAATVKTIPGLKYSLTYATDVGATTYAEVTTPEMAEEATMTLTDTRTAGEGEGQRNPNKGFYRVKVSK